MMTIDTKKLTYDTYLTLPEIKQRYEVLDGELFYMTPSPTPEHQRIALNLSLKLAPFVREHRLGELFFAPLDVIITRDPLRTRQPDLLFVSNQRRGIIGLQQIEGGPDLIVEILSPSNTRADVEGKLQDYWTIEIRECWLVSPEARTVEILQRGATRFERLGLYGMDDLITSNILPDLHLSVADIYQ
jgi:Uma2 family endonuclease